MEDGKRTIVIGSGKGGVGKSTVSVNLALALADGGKAVGLLDADLYGPSVPLMLGLARREWTQRWDIAARGRMRRIAPVERYGIEVMSFGFVLGEDQPMGLEALGVGVIVRQLAQQVQWSDLDYLVVDLPPGTGDIQQVLLGSLPISGALVVVTPQDVAHLDGKKAVRMYEGSGVRVLGAVENMSALRCPHCGEAVSVFPPVRESRSLWAMGVDRLASIPLDPSVAGAPVVVAAPDSSPAAAFRELAATVDERVR